MKDYFLLDQRKVCSKVVAMLTVVVFALSFFSPISFVYAETRLDLPSPGEMVSFSHGFNAPTIKGMNLSQENALMFDFVIDKGDSRLEGEALSAESQKLVKYFLAALTIPDDEVWVNLSPYEEDTIIPNALGQTELGKDMLSQDYLLKQLTASLTSPQNPVGQDLWNKIYMEATKLYGTTEIPVNTFSKVWIVPDKAVVVEKDQSVFIAESHLKVMLEKDYLALQENMAGENNEANAENEEAFLAINEISASVMRDTVIPQLEWEINYGKNFAPVRQIFHSVILANWYKQNLKEGILSKVYVDQHKIAGIEVDDDMVTQKIYDQYLSALEEGVYNVTREDFDPSSQTVLERRYFSGGVKPTSAEVDKLESPAVQQRFKNAAMTAIRAGQFDAVGVRLQPETASEASDEKKIRPIAFAIEPIETWQKNNNINEPKETIDLLKAEKTALYNAYLTDRKILTNPIQVQRIAPVFSEIVQRVPIATQQASSEQQTQVAQVAMSPQAVDNVTTKMKSLGIAKAVISQVSEDFQAINKKLKSEPQLITRLSEVPEMASLTKTIVAQPAIGSAIEAETETTTSTAAMPRQVVQITQVAMSPQAVDNVTTKIESLGMDSPVVTQVKNNLQAIRTKLQSAPEQIGSVNEMTEMASLRAAILAQPSIGSAIEAETETMTSTAAMPREAVQITQVAMSPQAVDNVTTKIESLGLASAVVTQVKNDLQAISTKLQSTPEQISSVTEMPEMASLRKTIVAQPAIAEAIETETVTAGPTAAISRQAIQFTQIAMSPQAVDNVTAEMKFKGAEQAMIDQVKSDFTAISTKLQSSPQQIATVSAMPEIKSLTIAMAQPVIAQAIEKETAAATPTAAMPREAVQITQVAMSPQAVDNVTTKIESLGLASAVVTQVKNDLQAISTKLQSTPEQIGSVNEMPEMASLRAAIVAQPAIGSAIEAETETTTSTAAMPRQAVQITQVAMSPQAVDNVTTKIESLGMDSPVVTQVKNNLQAIRTKLQSAPEQIGSVNEMPEMASLRAAILAQPEIAEVISNEAAPVAAISQRANYQIVQLASLEKDDINNIKRDLEAIPEIDAQRIGSDLDIIVRQVQEQPDSILQLNTTPAGRRLTAVIENQKPVSRIFSQGIKRQQLVQTAGAVLTAVRTMEMPDWEEVLSSADDIDVPKAVSRVKQLKIDKPEIFNDFDKLSKDPQLVSVFQNREVLAKLEQKGGINFNANMINLKVVKEGKGVTIPLPATDADLMNMEGLYPVIINIAPATMQSVPFLSSEETNEKTGIFQLSQK